MPDGNKIYIAKPKPTVEPTGYQPPEPNYVAAIYRGKTWFWFDQARGIVKIIDRGEQILFDLATLVKG